jgi:hypothetical protein
MLMRAAALSIEKFQMSASVGLWMSGITIAHLVNSIAPFDLLH